MNSSSLQKQWYHQFQVEQQLAKELKNADRTTRKKLYPLLYQRLFEACPYHPRLLIQNNSEQSLASVQAQLNILASFLTPTMTVLEIAPGDCQLSYSIAPRVQKVIGIDLSCQSRFLSQHPKNFQFVLYDGFSFPLSSHSIDLVFSYQVIEHIHPDDLIDHFKEVYRVLKPQGLFVFDTPHAYSGPHDVSRYFCQEPQGLHLREWTFVDLLRLLHQAGFQQCVPIRRRRPWCHPCYLKFILQLEQFLKHLPYSLRRFLSSIFIPSITMAVSPTGEWFFQKC